MYPISYTDLDKNVMIIVGKTYITLTMQHSIYGQQDSYKQAIKHAFTTAHTQSMLVLSLYGKYLKTNFFRGNGITDYVTRC